MLLCFLLFCLGAGLVARAEPQAERLPVEQLERFGEQVLAAARGRLVAGKEIPRVEWKVERRLVNASIRSQEAFLRGPFTLQRLGHVQGFQYPSGSVEIDFNISLGLIEAEYPKVIANLWDWSWTGALTAVLRDPSVRATFHMTKSVFSNCQVDVHLDSPSAVVSFKGSGVLPKSLLAIATVLPGSLISKAVFKRFLFPILEPDLQTNLKQAANDILCNNTRMHQ